MNIVREEANMASVGRAVPKIVYPQWEPEYFAALLELDPKKRIERVATAETAICDRAEAILQSSASDAERQAMQYALAVLRVLKKQRLSTVKYF